VGGAGVDGARMNDRTSNLVSQIRGCLEWRDGPLAPDRRVQVIAGRSEEFWEALRLLFGASPVETSDRIEAPHSGFCAVARGGRCDCGTDALNGKSQPPPFEPIIQCDTTTARIQKLIEMDAVPSYVVRALLHERDSWRENYWMRMEQIAKQSSPEEPTRERMVPSSSRCLHTWESFDDGQPVQCQRTMGHVGPHACTPEKATGEPI
jgi:hypothetical protein